MKPILIALAVALASPVLAQQPQRVTVAQILQSQIGALAGQNAQCVEQASGLQEQLVAAQARIKELEAAHLPAANSAPAPSPPN